MILINKKPRRELFISDTATDSTVLVPFSLGFGFYKELIFAGLLPCCQPLCEFCYLVASYVVNCFPVVCHSAKSNRENPTYEEAQGSHEIIQMAWRRKRATGSHFKKVIWTSTERGVEENLIGFSYPSDTDNSLEILHVGIKHLFSPFISWRFCEGAPPLPV